MSHEKRTRIATAEVRSDGEGKPNYIVGRPVVYDSWSDKIGGQFVERLQPGCFDRSLADDTRDVIACINHDARQLLGRKSSGTLRLIPDATGIVAECRASEISYAKDLAESIRRGDIRGMSFIFEVIDDAWSTKDGIATRTVKTANLYEVSWVIEPCYPATDAGLRSVTPPAMTAGHATKLRLLDTIERS